MSLKINRRSEANAEAVVVFLTEKAGATVFDLSFGL
jgi:hypothetical protein